jgi:hypothetical protein
MYGIKASRRLAQPERSPLMSDERSNLMGLGMRRFTSPKLKLRDRVANALPATYKINFNNYSSLIPVA